MKINWKIIIFGWVFMYFGLKGMKTDTGFWLVVDWFNVICWGWFVGVELGDYIFS